MQRKTQDKQTPKINQCAACGMMSFPSQRGVFGAKEKPVVIQSAPPNNTLNQSDSDSDSDDLGRLPIGCAACGMMSFPTATPSKKC